MITYIGERTRLAYALQEKLTHEEWTRKNVYFTGTDVSPIPGAFNINKSPQYIKLFQLMDRPATKEVWGKWASQAGKSLFTMLILGYKLDTEPAVTIYATPTKEDIPILITTKIDPVLKCMPRLWNKIQNFKIVETIRGKSKIKEIPGGQLVVLGSSVKERKSKTSPFIVMDEIAEFEKGATEEFSERTKSFSKFFPKIVGVSTIVNPDDEICTNYNNSEVQLEWHFICPSCETNFYPDESLFRFTSLNEYAKEIGVKEEEVDRVKYLTKARHSAHMKCPHCSHKIDNKIKDEMIFNNGMDWFYAGSDKRFEVSNLTSERSFGFDMNSFGSFFVLFEDVVEKIIKNGTNEVLLDKLYRGWFNKFYESKTSNIESNDILLLESEYEEFIIPDKTVALYLGVDVQKDHFWATVDAYTYGMKESHCVLATRLEDWQSIVELMERDFYYKDGRKYGRVRRTAIDQQGYYKDTNEVDEFTGVSEKVVISDRPLETRNFIYEQSLKLGADKFGFEKIYGIRGKEFIPSGEAFTMTTSKVVINGTYKEQNDRTVKTLVVGTVSAKLSFLQSVRGNILRLTEDDEFDPITMKRFHFVNKTEIEKIKNYTKLPKTAYSEQITSEKYGYDNDKKGKKKAYKGMIQIKKDNHFLDCHGYTSTLAIMDNIAATVEPEPKKKKFSLARSL